MQYTLAQQMEFSATIQLALEKLEPVDLPLRLTVAKGRTEGVANRRQVVLKVMGEADEASNPTGLDRFEPGVEFVGQALADHGYEAASKINGLGHLGVGLDQAGEGFFFVLVQRWRLFDDEPGGALGR